MNLRQMFLPAVAALLCLSQPAFPQVNGIEVADGATASVFGGKSPMVKVTDAEGKELASIPIGKGPGQFIYSKSANTLYIVRNEKKVGVLRAVDAAFISAVNLTANAVDKDIKVPAGFAVGLQVSNDGRRLFYYAASNWLSVGADYFRVEDLKPPFEPSVTVIDTASNEVTATYHWFESFRAVVPKSRFFAGELLAASDEWHLVVSSKVSNWFDRPPRGQRLEVFSGQSPHPTVEFDPGGKVAGAMFSKDEKLLFVAVEVDKTSNGSLVVANLEKGTTVTRALADRPTSFFRLGSTQEPWLLGNKEMRSLSEDGELGDRRIPLNKPRKGEEGEAGDASAFLDGFPGETISLGEDYAAIQINNKSGGSRHKVALIDLKKLQVDAIIPTMSTAEIVGIRTGRWVSAFGMSMATGGTIVFIPNRIRNESLAARPDGRFLFVLDLEGHEVTVVDVQTATVVKRIAVNKSVTKLQISSDGKHLICFGKQIQQINLESNNLEN